MFGAFIGDTCGSRFEFNNTNDKNFLLFTSESSMTDDSYMTFAVMETLVQNKDDLSNINKIKKDAINNMVKYFRKFPNGGYGGHFRQWCLSKDHKPYNSLGNGAGMRISPVGWICEDIEDVKKVSKAITEVSHNHKEGIKGAECIALCVYYLRKGKNKEFIKDFVIKNYYPILKDLNYEDLLEDYYFDVTCMGSIPQAIYCFLISKDFEDCIRVSISIGGDSDTIAAMACSLAEPYYGIPLDLINKEKTFMSRDMLKLVNKFDEIIDYGTIATNSCVNSK